MILVLVALVRAGCGLAFFATGVSKVLRSSSVRLSIERYRLLPPFAVPIVASLLAPTEILAGALLIVSFWLPVFPVAWTLCVSLMLTFTAAVTVALARGLNIPCGCGLFINDHVIRPATILRNLAFLLLLMGDFYLSKGYLR